MSANPTHLFECDRCDAELQMMRIPWNRDPSLETQTLLGGWVW